MAIVKLNASKSGNFPSPETQREIHQKEQSDNHQPIGFTQLDLDMIALEDFVHRCPLPNEDLAD
ncbi:type IV secretion system protein VirE1 [Rhizobium lentis]|uniref:type IV secretion system protein VirE1 n=1 Tax=Rhizobium TaxID=379 RepID=UPI001C82BDDF|nr:type IV secretion system protein VirE1 [Rhizobium lentis]MBX5087503.1 type IV secretion system protein VirE1 [Rhizobium lentis]MBX5100217.1 type IV secretion system protein VirE1 [Rhizobium lentis]MBX5124899.1 type IV secretion system protein VirE1 [Rhizobium lentis]